MLDVRLEFIVQQARLVQLQVELQEPDIGGIGEARAMLGVGAAQASVPSR